MARPIVEALVDRVGKDCRGTAAVDVQVGLDPMAVGQHQPGDRAALVAVDRGDRAAGARHVRGGGVEHFAIALRVHPKAVEIGGERRRRIVGRMDELADVAEHARRGILVERKRAAGLFGGEPYLVKRHRPLAAPDVAESVGPRATRPAVEPRAEMMDR